MKKEFKTWVFTWKLFQECLEHHFFQNILKWKKCSKREFSYANCSRSVWNFTSFRTFWNGKSVQNVSFHVEIVPRVFGTSLLSEHLEMEKVFKTWVFKWKLFKECLGHHFFQNILKWKKCSKREFSYGNLFQECLELYFFQNILKWKKCSKREFFKWKLFQECLEHHFFQNILKWKKCSKRKFFIWKLFQECLEHHFFQNILKWKKCSKR